MKFLWSLLALLSALQLIAGWGDLGHRTVAYLAQKYLNDEGTHLVQNILRTDNNDDISDAAVWADRIKFRRPSTRPWHFIDAQDNAPSSCSVTYESDCNRGCVVSAIKNMTERVNDPSLDSVQRLEALRYLIHFIGDIHQPLHDEALARGGNDIIVKFDHRRENLHGIWDTDIPHKMNGIGHNLKHNNERAAAANWADKLFQVNGLRPLQAECSDIQKPLECSMQWARETNRLNCYFVLKNGVDWLEENDLGGEYFDAAALIVNEQIMKAGIRLAAWLNALGSATSTSTQPLVIQP
ncbi:S1/P1 nuclease [Aspergillus pseudocaelatus]|uniref:S1/P1 nuclease n=1 Tax=Aspergillus pseudocaelatus TaxID=1825620 RepID=A0ABQ6X1X6_9EURO|nr:S1/P1 nuclease [Aspergillus pseudocaelatus]